MNSMSNPLFIEIPPLNIAIEILYSLKIITQFNSFPIHFEKKDIQLSDEIRENITVSLYPYYHISKANKYLEDLTIPKCITLLRQILLSHGYILSGKDTTENKKHKTVYTLDLVKSAETLPSAMSISFS
jgi:hypothetical protein